jgi:protease-4
VAEGRKLTVDQVEAIAQGRVWIGADAKAKGLVDQLGGLDDALADARKRASLPDDSPVDVYPPDPTLLDFLNSFVGGDVTTGALGVRGVTGVLAEVAGLLGPDARAVVETSLASLLSFRGCHVQTVALVPFVLK